MPTGKLKLKTRGKLLPRDLESGYSKSVMEVNEKLFNRGGFLHGGVAFTLADSGMAVALFCSSGD